MARPNDSPARKGAVKIRYIVVVAVLLAAASAVWWTLSTGGEAVETKTPTFRAAKQDLVISVIEGGNLKALKSKEIKCNVEGQSTIIYLIPEGTRITKEDIDKGTRLVELDSSELRERLKTQEITFQSANADYIQSKEDYEIQKKQNESDITAGRLAQEFALLDIQRYLGEDIAQDLILVDEAIRRRTLRYLQLHLAWEIAGDLGKLKTFHEDLTRLARNGIGGEKAAEGAADAGALQQPAAPGSPAAAEPPASIQPAVVLSGGAGGADPAIVPFEGKLVEEKRVDALLASMNRYSQDAIAEELIRERAAISRELQLYRALFSDDRGRVSEYVANMGPAVDLDGLETLLSALQRYPQKDLSDSISRLREIIVEGPEKAGRAEIESRLTLLRDRIGEALERMNDEDWLAGLLKPDLDLSERAGTVIIEGASRQTKRDLENDIGLAMEEIKRAENDLEWTARLYSRGFVSRNDLEADKIALSRNIVELERAITALDLFLTYEFYKESEQLISDYDEAEQQLERTKARARAQSAQKLSALEAARATYELQMSRLEDYREQLENCVIDAEDPGLVVWSNAGESWGRDDRIIEEGGTVRERQSIITIPDISTMAVEVKVHETSVDRVAIGQKAFITVDALPDRRFGGEVLRIAVLPDTQSRWLNPDLKVYSTDVSIAGTHDFLKPGMSAQVEIVVQELKDVLCVPLQAVVARDRSQYCLRVRDGVSEIVSVVTGAYNDTFVEIKSGLEEGDLVLVKPSSKEWQIMSINGNGRPDAAPAEPQAEPGAISPQRGERPGTAEAGIRAPGADPGDAVPMDREGASERRRRPEGERGAPGGGERPEGRMRPLGGERERPQGETREAPPRRQGEDRDR